MSRRSPICERKHKKTVEYFKNNVPQFLSVRDKAEDLYWMSMNFSPSNNTASLIGMIVYGPRNTSRNHSLVNTIYWRQIKLYRIKNNPYVHMVQKCRSVLLGQASLKTNYVSYGQMKVLEQHTSPSIRPTSISGKAWFISLGQCKTTYCTAATTTVWLCSKRIWALNWPACSPYLSPIEDIWHIIKESICKRWPQTHQLETYQTRMGPNSNTTTLETHNLNAQTS